MSKHEHVEMVPVRCPDGSITHIPAKGLTGSELISRYGQPNTDLVVTDASNKVQLVRNDNQPVHFDQGQAMECLPHTIGA